MLTQTVTTSAPRISCTPHAATAESADAFGTIARCSGAIASEFSYKKDEEIYGEGEPSEYLYQVIRGAVRTYKLLNDGRRQIGAFHLPGDVFGLDPDSIHRLTAEAISDTTVRLLKRRSLEVAAGSNAQVSRNLWTMTAGDLRHAEDHMLLLGRKTAMERVATFLLEMDRRLAATAGKAPDAHILHFEQYLSAVRQPVRDQVSDNLFLIVDVDLLVDELGEVELVRLVVEGEEGGGYS